MDDWRSSLTDLLAVAEAAPQEDIPDLLAELERAKATALVRLLGAQNDHPDSPAATQDDGNDELMTPEEVAEYLKVDPSWVYRHAEELEGASLSDRCMRFRRSVIDRHLDRCMRRP